MLYSNNRKLSLSGWLQKNNIFAYRSPLRMQKFLFFYEIFSKVDQDNSDFSHLKGYQRGPVFSPVWGDYTKDREEFDANSLRVYMAGNNPVNEKRAQQASFLVSSLLENELSELTHQFNLWNSKKERIMNGEQQVELTENDFNACDDTLGKMLERMYPDYMIQNSVIIPIAEKYFIFSKQDAARLTEQHFDILSVLSAHEDLHNPVFVEIDSEGGLCID